MRTIRHAPAVFGGSDIDDDVCAHGERTATRFGGSS
jgi:hypothetical protein